MIKLQEITLDNGSKERLLQVRNPWGKREWTGDWSDASSKWTGATKAQVQLESKDDGIFWISMKDFDKFFYQVTICYYRDDYDTSCIVDEHSKTSPFGICKFTYQPSGNSRHTPIAFSFNQVNWRFIDKSQFGDVYMPAGLKLIVAQLIQADKPMLKYLGGI